MPHPTRSAVALALACAANLACAAAIEVNQVGYLPAAHKVALVPAAAAERFTLVDAASGKAVFEGKLGAAASWDAGSAASWCRSRTSPRTCARRSVPCSSA